MNVSLLKWDMYHRIRAFGQEADDTRTVNHLKRPQTEKAKFASFPPFRDLSAGIYLPRYGHQNSENGRANRIGGLRDMLHPRGWALVSGWRVGALRLLGVESPSPSSEELPVG